jgi:hypothetical protein
MGTYSLLDLVPKGRDEHDGFYKMDWVRHHDRTRRSPRRPAGRRLVLRNEGMRSSRGGQRAGPPWQTRGHCWRSPAPAHHGLSPATGWMLAAACGVQAARRGAARRALRPIAFGQVASMCVLAWAVSHGLSIDRADAGPGHRAAGHRSVVARHARHLAAEPSRRAARRRPRAVVVPDGLGAGHGADAGPGALAAVRARVGGHAHGPGLIAADLAVAAVAVHTAAMLFVTGLLATGVCRGSRASMRAAAAIALGRDRGAGGRERGIMTLQ